VLVLSAVFAVSPVRADEDVFQSRADFIAESFPSAPPEKHALWIKKGLEARIQEVLGHRLGQLRVRYWVSGRRTAWILDEIGKERRITAGIVVDAGRIEKVRILIYRESIGWEVRFPFFTDQFHGAVIRDDTQLDRNIDGISGATLSTRAVTKLARLALILDAEVDRPDGENQENAP
jgi:hypothetical protein